MSEREFTEVKLESNIEFVKPAELEKSGPVEGTFLEMQESKIEGYQPGYKFEREDGSIFVVNGCAALNRKMAEVAAGSYVRLEHRGKKNSGKGQPFHDIAVLIA